MLLLPWGKDLLKWQFPVVRRPYSGYFFVAKHLA